MRLLTLLSEQPLVRALGWSLLHFMWEGTIVAGLLALLLKLLTGRSAQLRYALVCGALLLVMLLPVATFAYLAVTAHDWQTVAQLGGQRMTIAILSGSISTSASSWFEQLATWLNRVLPWILAVWIIGVFAFLTRLNVGLMVTRRIKLISTHPASAGLHRVFENLKARLEITRSVRLAYSALVQVPTVIGWLRPVVLIPIGCLTGLSSVQIEAVLAHELAHIRRHDYLVSVLQSFVEALLFYHPAVWWVSKQLRIEREDCCDDLAVRVSGDSLAYAKALSFLEEHRSSYPAVSLGANGGALAMRIKRLLGYEQAPAFSQLVGTALLAMVVAGTALGLGTLARAQAGADNNPASEDAATSQAMKLAYTKWLNEDVRWIISSEEAKQFANLPTDDERNEFIKQFWGRRDAQAAANGISDFRGEYYRRMAYANQHFAAVVPGWKTDRGRIYILYGTPNSVDSHPTAVGTTKSYEVWHYNAIWETAAPLHGTAGYAEKPVVRKDVDMKFIDTCSCGNFQLQPSPR